MVFSHLLKKQNFIKINILIQKSLLENPHGKLNQCLSSYNDMDKSLVIKGFMSTKGGFEPTDLYADWPCTTLYLISILTDELQTKEVALPDDFSMANLNLDIITIISIIDIIKIYFEDFDSILKHFKG